MQENAEEGARSARNPTHVVRDDDGFYVVVGWDRRLDSFFAYVRGGQEREGETEPLLNVGRRPGEIPTLSALAAAVGRFATLEPAVISALRHEAKPLGAASDRPPGAG